MTAGPDRMYLPLLLTSPLAAGLDEKYPLDRVRLQKAVFILMQGSAAWSGAYDYRPYNWGPYSSALTNDTDQLIAQGILRVAPAPGSRYGSYTTTPAGEEAARRLWEALAAAERKFLVDVRAFVTGRSFDRLLRDVYAAYPQFATKSLFRQ